MSESLDKILQAQFFEKLKDIIPPSITMVDELSEVLGLSKDSVYRRIRNETSLSLEEIVKLCKHYKVSFDLASEQESGNVTFFYELLNTIEDFKKYLTAIRIDMDAIARSMPHLVTYTAIDIPIFHHFQFRELTAFKVFYWMRSIILDPSFKGQRFCVHDIDPEVIRLAKELYDSYVKVHSVEIWTAETVISQIDQIRYCWESGLFQTKEDALLICKQTEDELLKVQQQAEFGTKDLTGNKDYADNFKLYYSEIGIGNNCIMTEKGQMKAVYLSFHTLNKLFTTNQQFCQETERWLNNMIHKSILISEVSEKYRYQFFKNILELLVKVRKQIAEE